MAIKFFTNKSLLEAYPYKTTLLDGLCTLSRLGISPDGFGGHASVGAKVKGEDVYILADSLLETLAVGVDTSKSFTSAQLKSLAKYLDFDYKKGTTKEQLLEGTRL